MSIFLKICFYFSRLFILEAIKHRDHKRPGDTARVNLIRDLSSVPPSFLETNVNLELNPENFLKIKSSCSLESKTSPLKKGKQFTLDVSNDSLLLNRFREVINPATAYAFAAGATALISFSEVMKPNFLRTAFCLLIPFDTFWVAFTRSFSRRSLCV